MDGEERDRERALLSELFDAAFAARKVREDTIDLRDADVAVRTERRLTVVVEAANR